MTERPGGPWAATLPLSAAAALSRLRLSPGIRVAASGDMLWLRGERHDAPARAALEHVAPVAIYSVGGGDVLTRLGEQLPHGPLPRLAWTPIAEFVCVAMPQSLLAGTVRETVSLTLTSSGRARQPNALLTSLGRFAGWANDAPDVRFRPLRYAVDDDRVLVVGTPMPSIDGVRLYEAEGICVPCGFEIAPPLDAASIRRVLSLAATDFALFEADRWHLVPGDSLVPVSRSSVRITAGRASA